LKPRAFNRQVHAAWVAGSSFVSAEELLRQSDFISLHVPLLAETRHMIGAGQLRMMKPTAILVNTSRGPVVDEAAVAEALASNVIAGAGLDVFEQEPKVSPSAVDTGKRRIGATHRQRLDRYTPENVVDGGGKCAGGSRWETAAESAEPGSRALSPIDRADLRRVQFRQHLEQ
jgi:lactate dehydrogenase-like 2-hydroxyacid dehydrogenase